MRTRTNNPAILALTLALTLALAPLGCGGGGSDDEPDTTVVDSGQDVPQPDVPVVDVPEDTGNDTMKEVPGDVPPESGPDAQDTGKDTPAETAQEVVDDPGPDMAETAVEPLSFEAGPEGIEVELPEGGFLRIPFGALDATWNLTITTMVQPDGVPMQPVGPFYRFEPSGLLFAIPATLQLPYMAGSITDPMDNRFAVGWKEDGGAWTALTSLVDTTAGTVTALVPGFSEGGPGYWGEDPPPCSGPEACADPVVQDCWNTDCQDGFCVEVQRDLDVECFTNSLCFFNGKCDEEGFCKGTPKVCNNPPGPEACYKKQCDPATGACVYPLDGECGVDKDCADNLSCVNCKCANCITAKDCGADNPEPCDTSIDCVDGKCVTKIKPKGTPCTNENLCDINDKCTEWGSCEGSPKPCNEPPGLPECYTGSCWDDETGECDYDLKNECGVDGDCMEGQTCEACVCKDPECYEDKDCKDDDPADCFKWECDNYACKKVGDFDSPCDDNNACTENDECAGSSGCKGWEKNCDNAPSGTMDCWWGDCWNKQTGECEYSLKDECATDADCKDNKKCKGCKCEADCTEDTDCPDDDPNDCMRPWCFINECKYKSKDINAPCDDGDPCTANDICSELWGCKGFDETVCDQPPADPTCHVVPGTCDGGCKYDKKPAGTACGEQIGECYQPKCDGDAKCVNEFLCPAATQPCHVAVCIDAFCDEDKDPNVQCAYHINCGQGQKCNTDTCTCEDSGEVGVPNCELQQYELGLAEKTVQEALNEGHGNDEGLGNCPDKFTYTGYNLPHKVDGPDKNFHVPGAVGDAVVAAAMAKGTGVSTQIKAPCGTGQEHCYGSTWSGTRAHYPPAYKKDAYQPKPGASFWAAAAAKILSPILPIPPITAPMAPAADGSLARIVVDSWKAPDQTIDTEVTLYWNVLSGAQANDLPASPTVLETGVKAVPESFMFGTDQFQTLGCAGLDDALGTGTPDLFYQYTTTQAGLHEVEVAFINERPVSDTFIALMDDQGACVAVGKGNGNLRFPVELDATKTYTLVVDAGDLAEEAVFFVEVSAYTGPANNDCGDAQAIAGLPFEVEGSLAGGFDSYGMMSACWQILAGQMTFAGQYDVAYTWTPDQDQYVKTTITSQTSGFYPYVKVTKTCDGTTTNVECADGIGIVDGETEGSVIMHFEAGVTYWIIVDGGTPQFGDYKLKMEAGTPDVPDTCAQAVVLPDLMPLTVNGRNLTDQFQGTATGDPTTSCSPDDTNVGVGLPDAVFQYTATEDMIVTAELSDKWGQNPSNLYVVKSCIDGLQAQCDGIQQDAKTSHVKLTSGETMYLVLDGWADWFYDDTVNFSWTNGDWPNESCATEWTVSLPWEYSGLMAFSTDDVQGATSGACSDLDTAGGDLVYRVDPAGQTKTYAAGVLSGDFDWTLYALSDCGTMPTADCLAGLNKPTGSTALKHILLEDQADPFHVVMDSSGEGGAGWFKILITEVVAQTHDTCETARVVDQLPYSDTSNTLLAANDYQPAVGECSEFFEYGEGHDVVYKLTVTQDMIDTYERIKFGVEEATFRPDIIIMKNGCDPSVNCHESNYPVLSVWMDEVVAGDVLYVIVDGGVTSKPAGLFIFTADGVM